jgi:hypothetical protein
MNWLFKINSRNKASGCIAGDLDAAAMSLSLGKNISSCDSCGGGLLGSRKECQMHCLSKRLHTNGSGCRRIRPVEQGCSAMQGADHVQAVSLVVIITPCLRALAQAQPRLDDWLLPRLQYGSRSGQPRPAQPLPRLFHYRSATSSLGRTRHPEPYSSCELSFSATQILKVSISPLHLPSSSSSRPSPSPTATMPSRILVLEVRAFQVRPRLFWPL